MYITLESDYAIRIILFLAEKNCRVEAKHIAENTEVTLRFALKILRKLVAGKLVRSYKGAQGGYELAKKPEKISLADVIGVIEGPYCLSRCLKPGGGCSRKMEKECKVNRAFAEISKEVRHRLSQTTFDQLM